MGQDSVNYYIDIESRIMYKFIKRLIDVIGALIGLIILSPVFLITAIFIKIESPGPIIFKQTRVGKNSETFCIYKFRSMREGAPILSTEEFTNATSFITKTGRFIRKTSIDELPQLINILKGEMSIVGPRPVIEKEEDLIEARKICGVDKILPGVTGWAQVNGRDDINVEEKVKYDYDYMRNQNILLDIKIIFMTVFKVIKSEGIKK